METIMGNTKVYQPLTLPATNEQVYSGAIQPSYSYLPSNMDSPEANCLMLSIGRQESNFSTRQQDRNGPAHGLWQFEGGGIRDVLYSSRSGNYLWQFCQDIGVDYGSVTIYNSLLADDILAAGLARLLLWDNLKKLPPIGDIDSAWQYYLDTWRPGKPSRARWSLAYAKAVDTIKGLT